MYNLENINNISELNKFGIYKITCLENDHFYIGSTIQSFWRRLSKHIRDLQNNKHHSFYLQNCFNKYGLKSLSFEILEILTDKEQVIKREQYYIDLLKPRFNTSSIAGSPKGVIRSKETIKKIQTSLRETSLSIRNKSGVKAVHWKESRNKWEASIRFNNKLLFLGRFLTLEEAALASKEAELKYY